VTTKVCAVTGCGPTSSLRKGWCYTHYERSRKWGDVRADVPVDYRGTSSRGDWNIQRIAGLYHAAPWTEAAWVTAFRAEPALANRILDDIAVTTSRRQRAGRLVLDRQGRAR
jgi:hypothetical protein